MHGSPEFSIEHLGLAARDPVVLKDWYVASFGAEVIVQLNPNPPAFMLRMPGGGLLEIYQAAESVELNRQNSTGGWRHLALRVTNIEQARAALESRGVTTKEPVKPAGGGGRVLFYHDLEGNLFHLVERPAGSTRFNHPL